MACRNRGPHRSPFILGYSRGRPVTADNSRINGSEIDAGHRQLAIAFEFLNRRLGRCIVDAGRLELPVTEIGQCALYRDDLFRWRDQFGDWIVVGRRGGSYRLRD